MKKIAIFVAILVVFAGLTSVALAVKHGQAGKSNVTHLYLYEKDTTTWDEIPSGMWGHMIFKPSTFVFNGHNLEAGTEYSLIYYPDPWPAIGLEVLGTGTVNDGGNIHIMDEFDFTTIPIADDDNDGAKIWLALTSDVGTDQMIGWNPEMYLFEHELINKG